MAVFKCKMCGGDLEIVEDSNICVCQYCETKQTVPTMDNDKKLTLFSRANRLRFNCEFDKAYSVYEAIIAEFSEEAEAYWGLVLCKYGVEYVDDPKTAKKIPTCHRSSFDSVMDDENFDRACEYAGVEARALYREEAKQIEELRRGIIEISSSQDPYDIFICYKETDANGNRTMDSVIAQDVYEALTRKGYKTFFSRISLEDKLGKEYEPYIFSALHSAKIMLVFGTDYEHFNAVWVKNEWSRFLKLMENNEEKALIPCFKNIDAYDMPKEFAHLQGQDMGKLGAIQDLLRGVEKILSDSKKEENIIVQAGTLEVMAEPLLKRANLFLKNKDFKNASEYFEKVLDLLPENENALLGKLLSEHEVIDLEELSKTKDNFSQTQSYAYLIAYCSEELKLRLENILKNVKENILADTHNALESRDFYLANSLCNRVLSVDKNNEKALLYKLLVKYEVSSIVELSDGIVVFEDCEEYRKLLGVCSDDLREKLEKASAKIQVNIISEMKRYVKIRHFAKAQDCYNQYIKLGIYNNDDVLLNKLFADLKVSDFEEIEIKQLSFEALPSYKSILKNGSSELKCLFAKLEKKMEANKIKEAYDEKVKRIIIAVLCVVVLVVFTVCFIITSNSPYSIYDCETEGDTVTITAIKKTNKAVKDGVLVFPDKINGKEVTKISSVVMWNINSNELKDSITTIELPSNLQIIGTYAFSSLKSLKEIRLPESLIIIEENAFSNCVSLESIVIPSNVRQIGRKAFSGCSNLKSIEIPQNVTVIEENIFYECVSLKNVKISDSVTEIKQNAFYKCSSLEKIVIFKGVNMIRENAFMHCDSLKIYCEIPRTDYRWEEGWNSSNCPVVWNYTGE